MGHPRACALVMPVSDTTYLPRLAERHLGAVLQAQPVAVLMGARQTGKSTLVRHAPALSGHAYVTLDNIDSRAQALADPEGIVAAHPLLVLDEVQRAPDLLIAIKAAVDASRRRPGQFVLTGSANLLAMKTVKETLAGRASYVTLWPLTRRERLGLGTAGCWSELASTPVAEWPALLTAQSAPPEDWRDLARRSAYPPVAVGPQTASQQADWIQGYLHAYVERDVPDLSPISRPLDLLRLLRAAAAQIGQIEHQVTWTRVTGLPRSTLSRWVDLLEMTYQLIRVPAFSTNRTKRLTRSPKVYWSDTATALQLASLNEPGGHHFENMVFTDLQAWSSSESRRPAIFHWRTSDQQEVDFVVELPSGHLLPIEVKSTAAPRWNDLGGLHAFIAEYGDVVTGGLVLHAGRDIYRITDRIVAAPWWRVL